jgi:hypothetical protein
MSREQQSQGIFARRRSPALVAALAVLLLAAGATAEERRLPEQLFSEDGRTRAAGIKLVVEHEQRAALPKIEDMARSDPGPGVRKFACWAMGKLGGREHLRTLRWVATNDGSPKVREQARRAVAAIEAREPVAPAAPGGGAPERGCETDADCGKRGVCDGGDCVPLIGSDDERAADDDAPLATAGYALEAGVIGIIGSGAVLGLSIGAAYRKEDLLPAIPIAVGATLITVVAAPAIKSGSKSARRTPGVEGSLAFRVIGWIAFGIHVGGSLALAAAIPFHWLNADEDGNGWTPQRSWIIANGAMGATALLCLAIDALVARSQAREVIERNEREPRERLAGPTLRPFVGPVGGTGAASGAVAGVVAFF